MAFSHVREAFRAIRSDLSNFIQQACKAVIARKLSYQEMAQGSTRIEHLEKSIDDYIIEQQNKKTRAKMTRDVKLLIEFLREKHEERNPEDIVLPKY